MIILKKTVLLLYLDELNIFDLAVLIKKNGTRHTGLHSYTPHCFNDQPTTERNFVQVPIEGMVFEWGKRISQKHRTKGFLLAINCVLQSTVFTYTFVGIHRGVRSKLMQFEQHIIECFWV